MADNTYRPGVYREQGGNKIVVKATAAFDLEGTQSVKAGSALNMATGSAHTRSQRTAATALTLDGSESGQTIITTVKDLEHQLPAATAAGAGGHYRFALATAALSTGNGLRIAPATNDIIHGNGLSAATGARVTLAGANDRDGDVIELESDGSGGWYITALTGTWTLTTAT